MTHPQHIPGSEQFCALQIASFPGRSEATLQMHIQRIVWFPDPSCMGGASTRAPPIQEGSGNQTTSCMIDDPELSQARARWFVQCSTAVRLQTGRWIIRTSHSTGRLAGCWQVSATCFCLPHLGRSSLCSTSDGRLAKGSVPCHIERLK